MRVSKRCIVPESAPMSRWCAESERIVVAESNLLLKPEKAVSIVKGPKKSFRRCYESVPGM